MREQVVTKNPNHHPPIKYLIVAIGRDKLLVVLLLHLLLVLVPVLVTTGIVAAIHFEICT